MTEQEGGRRWGACMISPSRASSQPPPNHQVREKASTLLKPSLERDFASADIKLCPQNIDGLDLEIILLSTHREIVKQIWATYKIKLGSHY